MSQARVHFGDFSFTYETKLYCVKLCIDEGVTLYSVKAECLVVELPSYGWYYGRACFKMSNFTKNLIIGKDVNGLSLLAEKIIAAADREDINKYLREIL